MSHVSLRRPLPFQSKYLLKIKIIVLYKRQIACSKSYIAYLYSFILNISKCSIKFKVLLCILGANENRRLAAKQQPVSLRTDSVLSTLSR